jgi:hypothetical protein
MLRRHLLILVGALCVSVVATIGILQFSENPGHFDWATGNNAKGIATLTEHNKRYEQQSEFNHNTIESNKLLEHHAEPNLYSAITASTAAAVSRPTTTSPPPAFLLNNPNVSCFTSNGGHGTDGFGSQLQYLLAGIAIAHHAGINFAWVSFIHLEHKANLSQMEEFAGAAHAFRHQVRDLGKFAYHADHQPTLEMIQNFKHRAECSSGNAPYVWFINAPKLVLDENPGLWVAARDVMRRAYLSTPKPDVTKYFVGAAGVTHVVMFQRRHIAAFDNRAHGFLPNEYYLAMMQRLRIAHTNAHFYLLSMSNMSQPCGEGLCDEQFEDFKGIPNLTMLLDLPLTDSFHIMVSADILVDSMSSFSYAAAVLTLGQVYHHGGFHALVPGHLQPFPLDHARICVSRS